MGPGGRGVNHLSSLSATKIVFFFLKEKKLQNVLKGKNMYFEGFQATNGFLLTPFLKPRKGIQTLVVELYKNVPTNHKKIIYFV